jgi:hypothetical protein
MAPRHAAPEQSADLSAMREIANLSARAAIARHSDRRISRTAMHQFVAAIAGLGLAGLLMWWAKRLHSLPTYAGLLALAVSIAWLCRALRHTKLAATIRRSLLHQADKSATDGDEQTGAVQR